MLMSVHGGDLPRLSKSLFLPAPSSAGSAIAYLFLVISPTPAGIGIVEGIMPLALSSLNVPWSQAIIVTLAYRGVTFWFPLGSWRDGHCAFYI
jgi:hypothetical protein